MQGNEERMEATRRGLICRRTISFSNFANESWSVAEHVVIIFSKLLCPCGKFRCEHLNI